MEDIHIQQVINNKKHAKMAIGFRIRILTINLKQWNTNK